MPTKLNEVEITGMAVAEECEKNFICRELSSSEERDSYRMVLANIESSAFSDDPNYKDVKEPLMKDMPDTMYFSSKNILVVLETPEHEVEGFTFLEYRDHTTVYETITAVIHKGHGFGKQLLQKRDQILKDKGFSEILTHVSRDGDYAKVLEGHYESVDLKPHDDSSMSPNQKALRLRL